MTIERSCIVAIQKRSSPDFLRAVFSAWRNGSVAVSTDRPDQLVLPGLVVAEHISVGAVGGWFEERLDPDDDPSPAQISFTSGTTGTPKPVVISRRALSDVTRRLSAAMGLDRSIREYVGVPVTLSFGLGRARAIGAVGGRCFLPPNGFRPDEFASMLRSGEVNALSAVPTLLRLIIAWPQLFESIGDRLKWLEIGSQHMSAEEKTAVRRIFPRARIIQHYGLTEASRTTFLDISASDPAMLESVGKPAGEVEVRVDEQQQICIRGPHVADGILTQDGLVSLTNSQGWLRTGDLGAIDARGLLHFRGRTDHLLNISGIKVPAELFEQALAERRGERRGEVAVGGRKDALRGEAVLVAHTPDVDAAELLDQVAEVADQFGLSGADIEVRQVPAIPRTDTGKVRRHELAAFAADEESSGQDRRAAFPASTLRSRLADLLARRSIDPSATYVELGADSLTFVQVALLLEDELGYLPENWENIPIERLEQLKRQKAPGLRSESRMLEPQVLLRAVAITGVVVTHAQWPNMAGGAYLLFALAGSLFARFRYDRLTSGRILDAALPPLGRILLAYYFVLLAYAIGRGDVDVRHWLLVANFSSALQSEHTLLPYYWFIANFVQTVLLYSVLFAVPAYRRMSREDPWRTGVATLACSFAIALAGRLAIEAVGPGFPFAQGHFDTRTPIFLFYIFAFGWCMTFAQSPTRRLVLSAAAVLMFPTIGSTSLAIWLIAGSLLALWLPAIRVPRHAHAGIAAIAAASFYIFIAHMFPVQALRTLPPPHNPLVIAAAIAAAILLGIVLSWLVQIAERLIIAAVRFARPARA